MRNKILIPLLLFFLTTSFVFGQTKKESKKKSPVVTLTSSNFKKETSKGLVFVDFWAPWCGPCRKLSPILEEIAREHDGTLKVGKFNTDNDREFSKGKMIELLPTIIVYKDGVEITRLTGLRSKSELVKIMLDNK